MGLRAIGSAPNTSSWGYYQSFHSNRNMFMRKSTIREAATFTPFLRHWLFSSIGAATPMGILGAGSEFQAELNRLAGTIGMDAQGAANVWAGTVGLDLLGALNVKNRSTGLGLNAVVNSLAGTQGHSAQNAIRLVTS